MAAKPPFHLIFFTVRIYQNQDFPPLFPQAGIGKGWSLRLDLGQDTSNQRSYLSQWVLAATSFVLRLSSFCFYLCRWIWWSCRIVLRNFVIYQLRRWWCWCVVVCVWAVVGWRVVCTHSCYDVFREFGFPGIRLESDFDSYCRNQIAVPSKLCPRAAYCELATLACDLQKRSWSNLKIFFRLLMRSPDY